MVCYFGGVSDIYRGLGELWVVWIGIFLFGYFFYIGCYRFLSVGMGWWWVDYIFVFMDILDME